MRRIAAWMVAVLLFGLLTAGNVILSPYPNTGCGTWAPDCESGLMVWLDADAITGLSNNDPVSTWDDRGPSNRDATGTNSPTYKTNQLNGKAIVECDGSNDYFTLPTFALGSATLTVLAVLSPATGSSFAPIIEQSTNYNSNSAWLFYKENSHLGIGVHPQSAQDLYSVRESSTTLAGVGTYYRVAATWDQSISGQESVVSVGGSTAGTDVRNDNTSTSLSTSLVHYLCSRAGASNYLNVRIAELVIYNTKLSSGALANWDTYVNTKWGL